MACDLTSEFSSIDKIRVAVYFSAHNVIGRAVPVGDDNAASKPAGHEGMGGTAFYKIALVDRAAYEADKWLFSKAGFKPEFETGRFVYSEHHDARLCTFKGCNDIGDVKAGVTLILLGYQRTVLELGDILVDRHGGQVTRIVEASEPRNAITINAPLWLKRQALG